MWRRRPLVISSNSSTYSVAAAANQPPHPNSPTLQKVPLTYLDDFLKLDSKYAKIIKAHRKKIPSKVLVFVVQNFLILTRLLREFEVLILRWIFVGWSFHHSVLILSHQRTPRGHSAPVFLSQF
ncbi:hypothetical protein Nepgr_024519 [Nepenthes gracilis]|uniref:Uncharacterized protein n=1 Tax=Nepenthes gracilis TaxID=150966 RepID=A0AAD3T4Z0_NEPGR|nr:hypothetical protein Nepgr_024519 [Nepenthes gracilis]